MKLALLLRGPAEHLFGTPPLAVDSRATSPATPPSPELVAHGHGCGCVRVRGLFSVKKCLIDTI